MPEIDWCTRTWWFLTAHSQVIRDIALTMAAIIGVPLVIWRTWATHQQSKAALRQSQAALEQAKTASQQADIASKRHEQQTDADRQRRITESFARAIEQLGSEKLEVRLGGIYALARIARESSEDHWPIMETLAAFVRETAALPYLDKEAVEALKEKERKVRRPPADVQAALTTIGHRCHDHDPPGQQLNLSGANLSRLDLREANLEGANLTGNLFLYAFLLNAWLRNAILSDTCLEGAILSGADITGWTLVTQEQLNQACGSSDTKLPGSMTIPPCVDEPSISPDPYDLDDYPLPDEGGT